VSDEVVVVDIDRSVIEVAFTEVRHPLFTSGEPTSDASSDDRSVEGRLAVVTGASGMLGAAFVAELAERGAHVCLVGRDLDSLRDTVAALDPGARTAMLRCDLASAEDVGSACDFIERIGSPVDLVVHAAGLYAPTSIARGSIDDLDEHYLLDVRGPYLLTQRLLPSLADGSGRIVFFAAGERPSTGGPGGDTPASPDVHRSISQAGVRAFASELRVEAGPLGIRVLTVQADDDLDSLGGGAEGPSFLRACSSTVLDVLAVHAVDLTELHLRRGGRMSRSEQR
jgi:NAD(P)-dependent dehydrogenase (short-subunit alcohol dehydrogenase family)